MFAVVRQARAAWIVGLWLACGSVVAQQRCEADAARPQSQGERFEDNADGTVTDKRLKLMWMRCSAGQEQRSVACTGDAGKLDWQQAQAYAVQLNQRGTLFFNDWRLPLLRELAAITEPRCTQPRARLDVFPGTQASFYWTSSLRPGDGPQTQAYALSFGVEGVELMDKKEARHVRLVRSTH